MSKEIEKSKTLLKKIQRQKNKLEYAKQSTPDHVLLSIKCNQFTDVPILKSPKDSHPILREASGKENVLNQEIKTSTSPLLNK